MSRSHGMTIVALIVLCGVTAVHADVSLFDDRLSLDATSWVGAHWWRADGVGLAVSELAFDRVEAIAGLNGRFSRVAFYRTSLDISRAAARDMYIDLHWSSGFGMRAGQFPLPLGFDAMTEPDGQRLTSSSFLVNFTKPNGIRDIGVLGSWDANRFSAAVAVVNGSGPNNSDNNGSKDFCARVAGRPLARLDADLGLRVYYGWPDSLWRSAAVEARLKRGSLTVQTELQNLRSQYSSNTTAYLFAAWDVGALALVGRVDVILPDGMRAEWMVVTGLDASSLSDRLRVMLDCSYHRSHQANWSVFGFDLRLQATL